MALTRASWAQTGAARNLGMATRALAQTKMKEPVIKMPMKTPTEFSNPVLRPGPEVGVIAMLIRLKMMPIEKRAMKVIGAQMRHRSVAALAKKARTARAVVMPATPMMTPLAQVVVRPPVPELTMKSPATPTQTATMA